MEWDMLLGSYHLAKFVEISGQIVTFLPYGLSNHIIIQYRHTHLQGLHRSLQLMNHRMHKVASHLIHLLL